MRRGANLATLSVNHPDVLLFLHSKNDLRALQRFNISISVTDAFMRSIQAGEWLQLSFAGQPSTAPTIDPITGTGMPFTAT